MLEATVGSSLDGAPSGDAGFAPQVSLEDVSTRLADALRSSGFDLNAALVDTLAAAVDGSIFVDAPRPAIQALLRVLLGTVNCPEDVHGVIAKVRNVMCGLHCAAVAAGWRVCRPQGCVRASVASGRTRVFGARTFRRFVWRPWWRWWFLQVLEALAKSPAGPEAAAVLAVGLERE